MKFWFGWHGNDCKLKNSIKNVIVQKDFNFEDTKIHVFLHLGLYLLSYSGLPIWIFELRPQTVSMTCVGLKQTCILLEYFLYLVGWIGSSNRSISNYY